MGVFPEKGNESQVKRLLKLLPALLALTMLFTGCSGTGGIDPASIHYVQLEEPKTGQDIAVFDTSMGEITVLLYTDEVPEIVQNFKDLVNEGYFDGQVIFQIDPDYKVAAFGSPDKEGEEGKTNDDKPKKVEYSQNLWPFAGSLCTITYQQGALFKNPYYDSRSFFMGDVEITEEDRTQMNDNGFPVMMKNAFETMGGIPAYSQYHSVYGKVISGMDVVNAMTQAAYNEVQPTEEELKQAEKDGVELMVVKRPQQDIVINKVTLSTYDPADFDTLDNCLTTDELNTLKEKSQKEQEEQDAASAASAVGETQGSGSSDASADE